jgi:anthranilate phosphoribosyltransferase
MLREMVSKVAGGENLTAAEAEAVMRHLVSGEASPALAGALLTALKMKGETADEITGFARGMREHAVRVYPRCERLVDTCGTGGGSVSTFNISTTAAFVVSGAGVSVAKHGNRAITSACGSADVLEALGVRIDLSPEQICACVEEIGIGFLFAQAHHPAMRHVGPIRRELPFRTLFNCLGPLTNPAGARSQVVGVYEPRLVPLLGEALRQLGCDRALVVHGQASLDEISTLGVTLVAEVTPQGVTCYEVHPGDFGLTTATAADLAPGKNAAENAAISRAILAGERGPRRDIVLVNAAAALFAAGRAESIADGLALAAESIDGGAAQAKLEALIAATNAAKA